MKFLVDNAVSPVVAELLSVAGHDAVHVLVEMASQTGQQVEEFVGALLRRIAAADVRFERGVPVLPRRPGAPTVTVEEIDRLLEDDL